MIAERLKIHCGDCREILPTLEPESVQCCVTSPPYWGLRDYGTAQWEGGSIWCEHLEDVEAAFARRDGGRTNIGSFNGSSKTNLAARPYKGVCAQCGARRIDSQLGLEATPEEYITNMVAVFRAVWRVLREDGTLWVNMGDSYAQGGKRQSDHDAEQGELKRIERQRVRDDDKEIFAIPTGWAKRGDRAAQTATSGLKPKDLCMMPARLAMALQADGWYLRSEIVWHKPNPMPESVTDRPTKAHEMIYLLAKQERYYYDNDAIREPQVEFITGAKGPSCAKTNETRLDGGYAGRIKDGWNVYRERNGINYNPLGRNKRSVWTIATQPYAEAHFATFPEEIPKLCILAGSRVGDTILDPFAGSGTTGRVALELGRRAVLVELNPAYVELARERTFVTPGFL